MNDEPVTITPAENGPYIVQGPVVLQDQNGDRWELPEGRAVALCRCGQSGHKPFCDGTHGKVGFDSAPNSRDNPYPF